MRLGLPALDVTLLGARMSLVDKSGWGGARKAQFPPFRGSREKKVLPPAPGRFGQERVLALVML